MKHMWGANFARFVSLLTFLLMAGVFIALEKSAVGHNILIAEGGIAETSSWILWMASGLGCVITALRTRARRYDYLLLAYFTLALGARELDLQKTLTTWNTSKFLNYFKSEIPLYERLLVLSLLVIPVLVMVPLAMRRWIPRFRREWGEGKTWPRDLLIWFATLILIVEADKFHLIAKTIGLTVVNMYPYRVVEETLEAALALFTFLILLPRWNNREAAGRPGEPAASS